jgi:penicillin-binding protein 1C
MENHPPQNLSSKNKRVLRRGAGVLGAVLASLVLADALRFGTDLPSLSSQAGVRILDRNGMEVRHSVDVNGERRHIIPLDAIPGQMMDAFVIAEDKRFYSHHGVDWGALARGASQSLTQFRKVSGGSTITMQLARTIWPELRGALHKPAQIIQAMRLEMNHPKGEILALYLNTVSFGNNISGVGAACRYFFDKSCDQLSSAQIAALAVLPRNPSLFINKPAALVERRNALLSKMLSNADPLALKQAKAEPVRFTKTPTGFFAPHLTERILEENNGRAEIRTTLDLELQKSIQELLSAETIKRRGTGDSGAVLVLDNDSGGVLAYVGSPDFFDPAHGMVDGVRVLRSPGSALKPFVYELAMENNWNLFSIVPDLPMVFSTKRAVYEPNNYGGNFSGPRTIR